MIRPMGERAMSKTIEEILAPKPVARPRIYAYSIDDEAHKGLLKVGQTTRDVKQRVAEQLKTAAIKNYKIELDESAERDDGTIFTDHDVRAALVKKGFENTELEWMRCTVEDVKTVLTELRTGKKFTGTHHETFAMRREQAEAVNRTHAYFHSIWKEDMHAVPRFLWNAKMRFGKTFTTYQLAKKLGAKRVLVVTFKPAVEDAWQTDLESHVDFDGWQYLSRNSDRRSDEDRPQEAGGLFRLLPGPPRPRRGREHQAEERMAPQGEVGSRGLRRIPLRRVAGNREGAVRGRGRGGRQEGDQARIRRRPGGGERRPRRALGEGDRVPADHDQGVPLPLRHAVQGAGHGRVHRGADLQLDLHRRAARQGGVRREEPRQVEPVWRAAADAPAHLPDAGRAAGNRERRGVRRVRSQRVLRGVRHGQGGAVQAQERRAEVAGHHPRRVRAARRRAPQDRTRRPPFPYSDVRLLPYLQHSFWFLPNVAACHAMANLLAEKHNTFWHDYEVVVAAGASAGIGLDALPPVREAIGSGFDTKTITLSCGKLTTGVTVPQWSSILMLRNLKSPETYFQAAFRVQSPWSIKNPNGDNPNEEEILKPVCFVFDFAPTRALRQLSEYGIGLSPNEPNPENAVKDLVSFLPVLAYDGANMTQIDAGGILDIAMAGTSATLLARKWESALLVNVDNDTLRRILDNPEAMAAVERIEGWRALGDNIIETIINKSEKVKELKNKAKDRELTAKQKKQLTEEEKEYKSKRKLVQEKLIKFATRIPAFMYLTDFRENTLQDVITKLEPDLFLAVTGLTVKDFHLLVRLKVFNTEQMNQAVFAFRRYEDASLRYTGIESHPGLTHYGLYDTVVARE